MNSDRREREKRGRYMRDEVLERGLRSQIGEREVGERRDKGEIIKRDRYREEIDMR